MRVSIDSLGESPIRKWNLKLCAREFCAYPSYSDFSRLRTFFVSDNFFFVISPLDILLSILMDNHSELVLKCKSYSAVEF